MTQTSHDEPSAAPRGRIAAIDIARGIALVAMAIYHFTWDLEFFGYVERGLTAVGGWKMFARCIASSFLVLVGISLYLAHRNGVRWPSFWRRWLMVAGAAVVISAGTYFAMPETFIFFGILHQIALASLLGLLFLRLPSLLTLAAAALVIAAPYFLRSTAFDHPAFWWLGLSSINPRSNDYVPLFPWFGAVLIGIAVARLAAPAGLFERLRGWQPGAWSNPLGFIGRHSLAFYLIHQPVLIGLVALVAQFAPPATETPEVGFRQACERTCSETRDEEFCARYCVCMLDELETAGALPRVLASDPSPELQTQVEQLAASCTVQSEPDAMPLEGEAE